MYRVGILGTENSHANFFAKTFNLAREDGSYAYPDFRVTALYALDKAPSEQICKEVGEVTICSSIEEMLPLVDCVMVTARHGKYHKAFAMPFIEKGMRCFIDKPFTCSAAEARELLAAAKKHGVELVGGSGCKHIKELQEVKKQIEEGAVGKVSSAVLNFQCDLESPYGGFYFYASHLIEMTMTVFGYEPVSVMAVKKNGTMTAIARYADFDVMMSFAKSNDHYAVVYGDKGSIVKPLSMDGIFDEEARHFVDIVRGEKSPMSDEMLVNPVFVMNAIEASLAAGGKEIAVERL